MMKNSKAIIYSITILNLCSEISDNQMPHKLLYDRRDKLNVTRGMVSKLLLNRNA